MSKSDRPRIPDMPVAAELRRYIRGRRKGHSYAQIVNRAPGRFSKAVRQTAAKKLA